MKQLFDINSNPVDVNSYSDIADSSKDVKPGGIFVAIKGIAHDGHSYVMDAINNGAALVLIDETRRDLLPLIPEHVRVVLVKDTLDTLGVIASKKYDIPTNIVAVTGTNGKTSVVFFVQQLLMLLGLKAAAIGTLGVVKQNQIINNTSLTTPGLLQMYKLLNSLKAEGINYVALEASSHGLIQHRLDHIPFKGGAFTSFSRDHLDYHKNMADYLKAKLYLFESLLSANSFALINADMEVSGQVLAIPNLRMLTYGKRGSFIKLSKFEMDKGLTNVHFILEERSYQFRCNLFGEFQIYNILCALGIVLQLGFAIEQCLPLLEQLKGVPGRMERVENSNVYVDYAHTDDALKRALIAMRSDIGKNGQIVVVFGCGGNRDEGKREKMGLVANEYADKVIVTDDNPRLEDASLIRKQIIHGCPKAIEIASREDAIKYAINTFPGSYILIAGKGHEKYQIIGDKKINFDDYLVAASILKIFE